MKSTDASFQRGHDKDSGKESFPGEVIGARRRVFSGVFSPLLLIILLAWVPVSPAATYDVYGGTKASWPGDGSWIAVPSLGDPDDGLAKEHLDFVGATLSGGGGGTEYSFYKYADATYAYFRVRVDAGTYTSGDWSDTIWVMIDGNADGSPDYALAWDTNQSHGLEFQVKNTVGGTWASTDFDDVDQNMSKKLTAFGTGSDECDQGCGKCWYFDIPTSGGTGYIRAVDGQSTTTWGTTMFIDIAVTWAYLSAASTAAHACDGTLPVLSASGNWKLQAGSYNNNDHNKISGDVIANTNPTDAMTWSSEVPTLVYLASLTATPSRGGVLLAWETTSETDTAGFHIWRCVSGRRHGWRDGDQGLIGGEYERITALLIPAEGESHSGTGYSYEDSDVETRYRYSYKLEAIDNGGSSQFFGPVTARPRLRAAVETLPQWGAVALLLALVSGGLLVWRRKA